MKEVILGRVGMYYKGTYDASTTYNKLDIITYLGNTYICILDTQGNDPTNETYWAKVSERGTSFIPSVDEEGNLSWSNDGGLENPATTNIRGPEGPRGPAGDHSHGNLSVLEQIEAPLTVADKKKLDAFTIYELPVATKESLGGIKVGDNVSIDNGILSADVSHNDVIDVEYRCRALVLELSLQIDADTSGLSTELLVVRFDSLDGLDTSDTMTGYYDEVAQCVYV